MSSIVNKIENILISPSDLNEINNLETKILEYEKYFNQTDKKTNFDLVKNIENSIYLFNKYPKQTLIINKIIEKLILFCDNISEEIIKSILNIFITNEYTYIIYNKDVMLLFVKYFTNIDILKNMVNLSKIDGRRMHELYVRLSIPIYIANIYTYIFLYSDDIINEKINELNKIITNLIILNYDSFIYNIADLLCEYKSKYDSILCEKKYNFISKLHNYIFCELNLINNIEYSDELTKILNKYK